MESCVYHNQRPQLIILRCMGSSDFFLEKVIFPYEAWCFDAPPDSRAEIWSTGLSGVELLDALDTQTLRKPTPDVPEWGLDQQQPIPAGCSGRGLQGDVAESPPTEVAVPC